jgi:hypothetical protein
MASYAHREEKGTAVNVASHLPVDVLTGQIDAAVVISNDCDLQYPVAFARTRVPVGLINPSNNYLAGALRGLPATGPSNSPNGQPPNGQPPSGSKLGGWIGVTRVVANS